jgi:hypothetical protein
MNALSRPIARIVSISALALALGACHRPPETPVESPSESTTETTRDPSIEANEIFSTRCTPCHGSTGGGDGPASAGLSPHPRNFHDDTWQASVTDQHIDQIIQFGGAAVGKSPAMPANPDLVGRDAVVAALRARVRSFRQ